jgi:hypothetical protein
MEINHNRPQKDMAQVGSQLNFGILAAGFGRAFIDSFPNTARSNHWIFSVFA